MQDYALQIMSGTSMAAPVVAASALLVRQYFTSGYSPACPLLSRSSPLQRTVCVCALRRRYYPSGYPNPSDARIPSGALMKAVIINSGTQLMGSMCVWFSARHGLTAQRSAAHGPHLRCTAAPEARAASPLHSVRK